MVELCHIKQNRQFGEEMYNILFAISLFTALFRITNLPRLEYNVSINEYS